MAPSPQEIKAGYVAEGYPFECGCGEMYRTAEQAWRCRKCIEYLYDEDYAAREVTDLRDGSKPERVRGYWG